MATHPDYSTVEGAYRRGYLQAIDDALRELDSAEDGAGEMTVWDVFHKVGLRIVQLKVRLTGR